jgi:hypothetical protein
MGTFSHCFKAVQKAPTSMLVNLSKYLDLPLYKAALAPGDCTHQQVQNLSVSVSYQRSLPERVGHLALWVLRTYVDYDQYAAITGLYSLRKAHEDRNLFS